MCLILIILHVHTSTLINTHHSLCCTSRICCCFLSASLCCFYLCAAVKNIYDKRREDRRKAQRAELERENTFQPILFTKNHKKGAAINSYIYK